MLNINSTTMSPNTSISFTPPNKLNLIKYIPSLNKLIAIGVNNFISLLDPSLTPSTSSSEKIQVFQEKRSFSDLDVSSQGLLAVSSFNGTIHLFEIDESTCSINSLYLLEGPSAELKSVSFSQNGNFVCAASRDKRIWIWGLKEDPFNPNEEEFECLYILNGHEGDVKCAKFINKNDLICSCGYDGKIIFWKRKNEEDEFCDEWEILKLFDVEKNDPRDNELKILEENISEIEKGKGCCQVEKISTCHEKVEIEKTEYLIEPTLWCVKSIFVCGEDYLVGVCGEFGFFRLYKVFSCNGISEVKLVWELKKESLEEIGVVLNECSFYSFLFVYESVKGFLDILIVGSVNVKLKLSICIEADGMGNVIFEGIRKVFFRNEKECIYKVEKGKGDDILLLYKESVLKVKF